MSRIRAQRGQSLIELIVVLTLIGILAAVITPSGTALPEMRLRAAAERLVSDLRYAQTLARSEGGRVGCTFNAQGYGYAFVRTTALTTVPDPLRPSSALVMDFSSEPTCRGITMTWTTPDAGILFDVLGAPRSLAYTAWSAPASISLTLNSMVATVTVSSVTGAISLTVTP